MPAQKFYFKKTNNSWSTLVLLGIHKLNSHSKYFRLYETLTYKSSKQILNISKKYYDYNFKGKLTFSGRF